jgi:hypothetical protein
MPSRSSVEGSCARRRASAKLRLSPRASREDVVVGIGGVPDGSHVSRDADALRSGISVLRFFTVATLPRAPERLPITSSSRGPDLAALHLRRNPDGEAARRDRARHHIVGTDHAVIVDVATPYDGVFWPRFTPVLPRAGAAPGYALPWGYAGSWSVVADAQDSASIESAPISTRCSPPRCNYRDEKCWRG